MEKEEEFVPPDGGYGWVIVLATTLINICVLPLVQCFGIIFLKDFETLQITSAETSFLLHLHSAIYCSLGLLGSPLLKKYTFRRIALIGTSLMSLGIFLSSFARSYGVLICTFSLLVGLGQGLMLPATYLATNTYFKKRLTLAVSFSVTGASISYIIMPQVCNKLLSVLQTTQATILVLAAISVVGIFCCFLLKPIRKPPRSAREEIELLNQETVYKTTTQEIQKESFWGKLHELFNLELLKDWPYVVAITGMSVSFASELNIILMLAFILKELAQFEVSDVALALSVQSVADIIGRLVVPLGGHYFSVSPKIMYGISLSVSTIGRTVISICFASRVAIFFSVCLIGLAKGIKAVYQSVIIPRYVELEKLPAANGLNMLLTGATSLALGPMMGAIHDLSGSYIYTLHMASILSMFCVVLWLAYYFINERKSATT